MLCRFATVLFVYAILAACSSASHGASSPCAADGDCASGLKCLGLATFASDGGCTESGKACSTPCAADADCASLGAGHRCFAGCGSAKTCGATQ